jgi:hypothetical protein
MSYTESDHLKNKEPEVIKTYHGLIDKLQQFGPLKIEPKKTSIHLGNRLGLPVYIPEKITSTFKFILTINWTIHE